LVVAITEGDASRLTDLPGFASPFWLSEKDDTTRGCKAKFVFLAV
jgi:hypothetical protein